MDQKIFLRGIGTGMQLFKRQPRLSLVHDYADQRLRAREEYGLRLVKRLARVDKNNNAKEEVAETRNVSGFLSR
jgi:hypothetical protein